MSKTGLYIHIPFCRKKCFYCSFIVAVEQKKYENDYVSCLGKEMVLWKSFKIDSVYVGGGTPSQLSGKNFVALMNGIKKFFHVNSKAEITIEVNPEDASLEKFSCYHDNGINRLSLGLQTFDDSHLKFLGRCHDVHQAQLAYDMAREHGFDNVSVDLIYGFPNQTLNEIDQDLDRVVKLQSDHVSLYSLTIDPGSKFFVHQVSLPRQQEMARQYRHVRQHLIEQGFEHYEVSNFAKQGKRSAHNMNYWQGGNYIGLGVGAHSHLDGKRWWNVSRVRQYINCIREGKRAEDGSEELSGEKRLTESLTFGLRMIDGVNLSELQNRFGRLPDSPKDILNKLIKDGFLVADNGRIKPALKGLMVLDDISEKLI